MWSNSLISQTRKQRLGEIKKTCPRMGSYSWQGQDQGSAFPQCIISLPLCMKDSGESQDLPVHAGFCPWCACMLSHVLFFAAAWTVAHQSPVTMGFSRQEHWSGLPCLLQGIFPTSVSSVSCINRWVLYHQRYLGNPCLSLLTQKPRVISVSTLRVTGKFK